jgi:hypothetical protein
MGRAPRITDAGGYRFFAGWRSDPFFFDTQGAINNLQFTGDDFFADKDVCSIVMEVPNSALGRQNLGLWARTLDGVGGKWVQADRGARPQQAVFLTGADNADYLASEPADDARFVPVFAHSLQHAGGLYAGGNEPGGSDIAAGHTALRSQSRGVLPQQRPNTH